MNVKDLTNGQLIEKVLSIANTYDVYLPQSRVNEIKEIAARFEALLQDSGENKPPYPATDYVVPVCTKCGTGLPDAELSICNNCFREGNAFVYPPCRKCGRSLDELEPNGICIECEASSCPVGCDTPCENCTHQKSI